MRYLSARGALIKPIHRLTDKLSRGNGVTTLLGRNNYFKGRNNATCVQNNYRETKMDNVRLSSTRVQLYMVDCLSRILHTFHHGRSQATTLALRETFLLAHIFPLPYNFHVTH